MLTDRQFKRILRAMNKVCKKQTNCDECPLFHNKAQCIKYMFVSDCLKHDKELVIRGYKNV